MPTNRRRPDRTRQHITHEVVEAWKRADFLALHRLLGLKPWQSSPLPLEITRLGVGEGALDPEDHHYQDDLKILALQRELLALAGWPDCRSLYQEKLREAEEWAEYCRERIEHPPIGEFGSGCDPDSREKLADAENEVAHRRELLTGLDAVQKRWASGAR
jgi:hypothetical protein